VIKTNNDDIDDDDVVDDYEEEEEDDDEDDTDDDAVDDETIDGAEWHRRAMAALERGALEVALSRIVRIIIIGIVFTIDINLNT
jgi:hypothetical protein